MTNRRFALPAVVVGLLTFTLAARHAQACTCAGPNPVCQAFFRTAAVFVGEVVSITEAQGAIQTSIGARPIPLRRVHLRISEAFSGVTTPELDVETGMNDADCGYAFRIGGSYVVFADLGAGALSTSICSPTKPVSAATTDLAFLRSLKNREPARGRLYGTAIEWDDHENGQSGRPGPRVPYVGARVIATGEAGRFEGMSRAPDGAYEILAPPGRYQITTEVPAGKYATNGWTSIVELTDVRGCAKIPVSVHSDGHIAGRVRDAAGRPVSDLTVELVPADHLSDRFFSPRHQERTTSTGTFEITRVPPGQYVIGFNTKSGLPYPRALFGDTRSPDTPRLLSLAAGARMAIGDLDVPPALVLRTLTGSVHDPGGAPIAGASVYLKPTAPTAASVGQPAITGPDGTFAVAILEGYRYLIFAELVGKPGDVPRVRKSSDTLVLERGAGPIALTIQR